MRKIGENIGFFGRLAGRVLRSWRKRKTTVSSPTNRGLTFEPLEIRQLLSVAAGVIRPVPLPPPGSVFPVNTWVASNWVDQTNPGLSPPAPGDAVTAPAGETAPNLGRVPLVYGQNAFGTIDSAVAAVASSGTVYVLPGVYNESNVSLDQPVSIVGPDDGSGVATVVPAVADSHQLDRSDQFDSGTENAFVIRSSNVSLSNLTIDGGSGYGYFGGVMTDWTTGLGYNDLSVTDVTVENTFGIGIYEDGGASQGSGDLIANNVVENVAGDDTVRGIMLLGATGQIDGNQVSTVVAASDTPYSNAAVGIYVDTFDQSGVTASIDGNSVSGTAIGINVMGLDNGSDITGNTIAMPSGDRVYGIVVRDMAVGASMTVQNNQIDATGSTGTGIYLYDNPDPNNAVLVEGNTISATAASSATGIAVSDDGSPFGDSTLAADYATLSGNTTSNLATGIQVAAPNGQTVLTTVADSAGNTSGTDVEGGTLQVGDSSGVGSGPLAVNGGTLDLNGNDLNIGSLSGSGGTITDNSSAGGTSTLTVDQTSDGTFSGTISDGSTVVGLSKTGDATLILSGANTYSGGMTVTAGTLQIGDGSGNGSILGDIADYGNVTFDNPSGVVFSGIISGSGSLTKLGSGTLSLSGTNTFSGATTIGSASTSGGVIEVDNPDALENSAVYVYGTGPNTANEAIKFGPGVTTATFASLAGQGSNPLDLMTTGQQPVTLTVGGNNTSTSFGGALWGSGTLKKVGSGVFTLSDANGNDWVDWDLPTGPAPAWGGYFVLAGGEVSVANVREIPQIDAGGPGGSLVFQGGMLQFTGVTTDPWDLSHIDAEIQGANFSGGLDLTQAGMTLTVTTPLTGSGSFTKAGAGTVILAGADTLTGGTTVTAGTLQIGDGSGNGSIVGDIADYGNVTFDSPSDEVFSGVLSGSGSLTKLGSGTLTLSGTNTFSGATTIGSASAGGGVIEVNNPDALENSAVFVYGTGPNMANEAIKFGPGVTTATFGSLADQGQNPLDLMTTDATPQPVTLIVGGNNTSTSFGGALWGSGTLEKIGSGAFTLSDANGNDWVDWDLSTGPAPVWAGYFVLAGGEVSVSSVREIPQIDAGGPGGSLVFSGGMLQFTADDENSWDLSHIDAEIQGTNFSGGLDLTQAGMTLTVTTQLTGTGGFTKAGPGTVVLDGANTLTGGTDVEGGTLQLGNSSALGSGSLTVNGVLDLNANDVTVSSLSGGSRGTITDSSASSGTSTLTVDQASGTTYSGVIQDGATRQVALTKLGGGTLVLGGSNTFSGPTTIGSTATGGGVIQVGNSDALENSAVFVYGTGPNTVNEAIKFGPGVTTATFASLAGQGQNPLDLMTTDATPLPVTLIVGGNNTSTTFAGALWGTGILEKIGSGVFTLSDANGNDWEDWDLPTGPAPAWGGYFVLAGGEVSVGSVREIPQIDAGGPGSSLVFQGGMLQFTTVDENSWDLSHINAEIQGAGFNGGLDFTQAGMSFTLTTQLTGSGSFTKAGAGTVNAYAPDGLLQMAVAQTANVQLTTTSDSDGTVPVSSSSGSGYLMYSAQRVQTRFGASGGSSDSFIAVIWNDAENCWFSSIPTISGRRKSSYRASYCVNLCP